jgi:hypothetical protein
MQCNILDPTKNKSKMGMEVCSWTKEVRVFSFVVVTGREEGVAGAHDGMESNQIKSNLYHIISYLHQKPPQKSFTPPMICHIVIC